MTPAIAYTGGTDLTHWIAGRPHGGASGSARQSLYNPATGEVAREVWLGGAEELAVAVAAARTAQPAWGETPPIRRSRVLNQCLVLMKQNKDRPAAMITAEHEMVFTDARGEVMRGIDIVE